MEILQLLLDGSLDLPERPELPERPPKYRKDQRIIGGYLLALFVKEFLYLTIIKRHMYFVNHFIVRQ